MVHKLSTLKKERKKAQNKRTLQMSWSIMHNLYQWCFVKCGQPILQPFIKNFTGTNISTSISGAATETTHSLVFSCLAKDVSKHRAYIAQNKFNVFYDFLKTNQKNAGPLVHKSYALEVWGTLALRAKFNLNEIRRKIILVKRKTSHVQDNWKICQPSAGLEPGASAYHDQHFNHVTGLSYRDRSNV